MADFEAGVWRRIRMERRPAASGALAVFAPLRGMPAWSMAMAATGLLVFGMWLGATMFRAPRHDSGLHPLLHPNTVAGAYWSLSSGGGQ